MPNSDLKALIADDVFNPAGVSLRSLGVNSCGDKLLGKEAVSLEDFFGNLAAYIGQVEKVILVHCEKTTVLQNAYRMADTRFAKAHVPGKVNGADHAHFLL